MLSSNFRLITLNCLLLIFISMPLRAQESAEMSIKATVEFIGIINKIENLKFGNLISTATAGTIVLNTDGTRVFNNLVASQQPGQISQAHFEVIGAAGAYYYLTIPTTVIITNAAGYTMEVDTFTTQPVKNNETMGLIPPSGKQEFYLGATLHVSSNQGFGFYTTNNFTVEINY